MMTRMLQPSDTPEGAPVTWEGLSSFLLDTPSGKIRGLPGDYLVNGQHGWTLVWRQHVESGLET